MFRNSVRVRRREKEHHGVLIFGTADKQACHVRRGAKENATGDEKEEKGRGQWERVRREESRKFTKGASSLLNLEARWDDEPKRERGEVGVGEGLRGSQQRREHMRIEDLGGLGLGQEGGF